MLKCLRIKIIFSILTSHNVLKDINSINIKRVFMKNNFLLLTLILFILTGCAEHLGLGSGEYVEPVSDTERLEEMRRTMASLQQEIDQLEAGQGVSGYTESVIVSNQAQGAQGANTPVQQAPARTNTPAPRTSAPATSIPQPQQQVASMQTPNYTPQPSTKAAIPTTSILPPQTPSPSVAPTAIKPLPNATQSETQAYQNALNLYRTGQFAQSHQAFENFLKQYPSSRYASNAIYWDAETFYARGQYPDSILTFKDILARFPDSSKTADALLKIALAYQKLGDVSNAALHATVLYEDWPNSEAARRGRQLNLQGL